MSSIVTALFKVTIGLLVDKGRDKAAEILKNGDVTDQRFHSLIVREIDDIKSKLDALSRKDLEASISFFEEGIALLYEVFDIVKSRNERGAATAQAACDEAFSLVEGITRLELTGLDESATRKLSTAKERFKDARREATRAFKNEGLKTSDRILAMKYRVMATILETVDNPADAVAPCGVCVKELNSLSAVQNSLDVQLKTGIQVRGLFGKEERREIIWNVCHVNRVIFDIALALGRLDFCPSVDIGENRVIPLCDVRVKDVLLKHGKEYCCVPLRSLGQEGEEEHKLKEPMGIATNSSGEFIVTDLHYVKVFDNSGKFVKQSSLSTDEVNTIYARGVATDMSDNIFVLTRLEKPGSELSYWVYKLTKTADLHHKFRLRGEGWYSGLSVSDKGKVVTLRDWNAVVEYNTDGEFVRSFGEEIIRSAADVIVTNDGRVMVADEVDHCVHIFGESGDYLDKFKLQRIDYDDTRITFHRAGEQVVVAGIRVGKLLQVEIYSKDGEFVYCAEIAIDGGIRFVTGITMTTKGRIACVVDDKNIFQEDSSLCP
nr:uncharacterized protein LOC131791168 [Pocillopora verrucosa]